jgi:hypothetical protein
LSGTNAPIFFHRILPTKPTSSTLDVRISKSLSHFMGPSNISQQDSLVPQKNITIALRTHTSRKCPMSSRIGTRTHCLLTARRRT